MASVPEDSTTGDDHETSKSTTATPKDTTDGNEVQIVTNNATKRTLSDLLSDDEYADYQHLQYMDAHQEHRLQRIQSNKKPPPGSIHTMDELLYNRKRPLNDDLWEDLVGNGIHPLELCYNTCHCLPAVRLGDPFCMQYYQYAAGGHACGEYTDEEVVRILLLRAWRRALSQAAETIQVFPQAQMTVFTKRHDTGPLEACRQLGLQLSRSKLSCPECTATFATRMKLKLHYYNGPCVQHTLLRARQRQVDAQLLHHVEFHIIERLQRRMKSLLVQAKHQKVTYREFLQHLPQLGLSEKVQERIRLRIVERYSAAPH